jgi:hypothetical protein
MAEIPLITATLAGVKHAIDIVRFLGESTTSLEQAEQKFKLAELTQSLAETMMQLAHIQIALIEKDQKIKEIEEAFQSKDLIIRVKDGYYEKDQDGHAIGDPYCMHCWEGKHKKYHLYQSDKNMDIKICASCKTEYWGVLPI